MRLHRLEMTAFGPFAETTIVDFDVLGADGLFLLHGHTGAGKTTVLDAIAFALYGRVPGARNDSKRLHSDHASPQTPPRVSLEATLGGRRVRLIRSPEFERPKRRGTGTSVEKPKATLEWLDGQSANLSRIPDIGDEVKRLLGMSAEQFFQVVLLPQGDFARFLRADNEEREKLLEKLFDTERFGTAEHWLAERRRASDAELAARTRGVENLIVQVGVTAGISATETVGPLDAVEWAEDLLDAARAELAGATTELERRREVSAGADAAAEQQRKLADTHRRMVAARRQLDEYAATAEQRAARRAELEAARRAEPVAAALDEARAAVIRAKRHDGETARAAQRLAQLLGEPGSADLPGRELVGDREAAGAGSSTAADRPKLRPDADIDAAIRQWSARIGVLDEVAAHADSAKQLTAEVGQLRNEESTLAQRAAEIVERREALPAAIVAAETRSRESADASAMLPALAADCERLQASASAAVDLAARRVDLDRARLDVEAARAKHLDAKERVLDLRERRLAGMAAELAGQLTDGHPCTVCGSADHPDPARPTAGAVSKDAEDRASAAEHAAEDARDKVIARIAGLERDIEGLTARGGDTDPVELAASLRTAILRYEDAGELADQSAASTAELDRLRAEETRLHDQLRAAETRRGTIASTITAAETRLTELTTRLRAAAGADGTIDSRRARLDSLIAAAGTYRTAEAEAANAWHQVRAIAVRVEDLARAAGFALEAGEGWADAETVLLDLQPDVTEGSTDDDVEPTLFDVARVAPETGGVVDSGGSVGSNDPRGGSGPASAASPRRSVPESMTSAQLVVLLTAYARRIEDVIRDTREQQQLEQQLEVAERAKALAEAVLAEPEVRAAAGAELGDLPALDAAVCAAREALDIAVAAHSAATTRVNKLEELSGQLWAAVDLIAPAQRAHEELAGLADVVAGRGANNRRMSLRSYVLAARLEEVALAGSARLRRMSGGRYEFVHTDRAGTHGRRGGLGLDIRDDYTGAIRPAKTLSGGETFMASLSLALGLADTVAAESGGIVLDTIFIDEGFGGLDADTLDAVMGVLDELRVGGRVVGLVSHVDEMRQRIPSRLHVIRGRAGSRLQATVA
ncbi:AAA family ATPase [Nocardia sp. NPDC059180]|uniref:AAA family ATPase n=1 Tax=Nocardia sp. NPDC059180 TaxID=3346761 RepID=UPI0036C6B7AB